MADYSKGKIYKITNNVNDEIYIGSTVQSLNKRFIKHKTHYKMFLNGKYNNISCFKLFDKYGIDNCFIELIESYPCETKKDLEKREGILIKNNNSVNRIIVGRTKKEYIEDNKEKIKKYQEDYINNNKEKIKDYHEVYYKDNKDKIKKYQEDNKEKIKDYQEVYKNNNKEKIKKYQEDYKNNNKDKINQKNNCECGGRYTNKNKSTHLKSKKHQNYLKQQQQTINNYNNCNITINNN